MCWLRQRAVFSSSRKVNNIAEDTLAKAREYAFLLLKFRLRSEKEVYGRLKKKKFEEKVIKETLSFLKDKDFINDTPFAKSWIESRLRKPLGLRRIRQELVLKGIKKEIIDRQLEVVKENYPEDELVGRIAKEKLDKLKGIEPQKAKKRIYSYLLRRGFSAQAVIEAMNNL